MAGPVWTNIPTNLLDQFDLQTKADDWAKDQSINVANDWADQQRLSTPPPSSDSLTNPLGTGNAPAASPEPAAGAPAPPPADASVAASPAAPAPAASTNPDWPAPDAPVTAPLATGPVSRDSQFGLGLSSADAMAFCGPTAAIAFAKTYGRNPTVDEAKQLAQSVGWNPNQGMAGVGSEQALLTKMGVQTKLENGVNWDHVASDANNGNPVIIDTPGHYFYVTGARQGPNGQEFNVGTSGTDLRRGATWMTANQMASVMGAPRAALYADHPLAQGPSVAERSPLKDVGNAVGSFAGKVADQAGRVVQAVQDAAGSAAGSDNPLLPSNILGAGEQAAGQAIGQAASAAAPIVSQIGSDIRATPASPFLQPGTTNVGPTLGDVADLKGKVFPSILDPNHPMNILSDPNSTQDQKDQAILSVISGVAMGPGGNPASGKDILAKALRGLEQYSPEQLAPVQAMLEQAQKEGTPLSTVGAQIQRWIEENPLKSATSDLAMPEATVPQQLPAEQAGGGAASAGTPPPSGPPELPPPNGAAPEPPVGPPAGGPAMQNPQVLQALQEYGAAVGPQSNAALVDAQQIQRMAGSAGEGVNLPAIVAGNKDAARQVLDQKLSALGVQGDPQVQQYIRNIETPSSVPNMPGLGGLQRAQQEIKGTIFPLSMFHAYTEGLYSSFSRPGGTREFANAFLSSSPTEAAQNSPMWLRAARAGVTHMFDRAGAPDALNTASGLQGAAIRAGIGGVGGAASAYTGSKIAGQDNETAAQNALIYGLAGAAGAAAARPLISDNLWRAVQYSKFKTFESLVNGGMADQEAAAAINRTFGGLNYAQMGRDQTFQDILGLTVQAPDWGESTIRQLGSAFFGRGAGANFSRGLLARTVVGTALATGVMNMILNGKPVADDPAHYGDVEFPAGVISDKPVYVGAGPGNLQAYIDLATKVAANPDDALQSTYYSRGQEQKGTGEIPQFVMNRVAAVPAAALDIGTGGATTYGGSRAPLIPEVASRVAPVSIDTAQQAQQNNMSPLAEALLLASGVNPRYGKGDQRPVQASRGAANASSLDFLTKLFVTGGNGRPQQAKRN